MSSSVGIILLAVIIFIVVMAGKDETEKKRVKKKVKEYESHALPGTKASRMAVCNDICALIGNREYKCIIYVARQTYIEIVFSDGSKYNYSFEEKGYDTPSGESVYLIFNLIKNRRGGEVEENFSYIGGGSSYISGFTPTLNGSYNVNYGDYGSWVIDKITLWSPRIAWERNEEARRIAAQKASLKKL